MVLMTDSSPAAGVAKEMPRIRRILVALDGSAYAERALAVASGLARVSHAEVVLLHVEAQHPTGIPARRWWAIPYVARNAIHEVSLYLARQEHALREQGVRAQSRLAHGEAGDLADVLARICSQMRIDLLVLVTHALDGSTGKAAASAQVAAVLRLVSRPVLLVGYMTNNPFAVSGEEGIEILVPLGKEDTGEETTWAKALALACGGRVEFLRSIEEPITSPALVDGVLPTCDRGERRGALVASSYPVSVWWADGDRPPWAADASGQVTTELVRRARGSEALIVLSIPTRQNQRPTLAALEVLRQSGAPVLMVPTGAPVLQVDGLGACGKSVR